MKLMRMSPAGGYAAVFAAACLWGLSGVVAKSLFEESVAPTTLVAVRLGGAAVVALVHASVFRRAELRRAWAHRGRVFALGLALAITQFAYYAAIALGNVATAVFLQYLAPALLVVWARVAERQPLSAGRVGAVGLAWAGAFLLVAGPAGLVVSPGGVAWGLASAVLFALYTVVARREVRSADPWAVLALTLASGALAWSVVVPPWVAWAQPYTPGQWLRFGHLAILATVVPFGLFLWGLRRVPPERAAILASVEPVVAALAAYAALGERLGAQQVAGACLILAAVLWTNWEGLREVPAPELPQPQTAAAPSRTSRPTSSSG
ncbi:putative inner membrane transporter YicL [bacterium HR32]|jgi:drug/metabolite transporter (DMT)-like permease|nr:putative inner membrane transporter YicL [bacterium HR32]